MADPEVKCGCSTRKAQPLLAAWLFSGGLGLYPHESARKTTPSAIATLSTPLPLRLPSLRHLFATCSPLLFSPRRPPPTIKLNFLHTLICRCMSTQAKEVGAGVACALRCPICLPNNPAGRMRCYIYTATDGPCTGDNLAWLDHVKDLSLRKHVV